MLKYEDVVTIDNINEYFVCKNIITSEILEYFVNYNIDGELALIYEDDERYFHITDGDDIEIQYQIITPIHKYKVVNDVYQYKNLDELSHILELLNNPFIHNTTIKDLVYGFGIVYIWTEWSEFDDPNLCCAVLDGFGKIV